MVENMEKFNSQPKLETESGEAAFKEFYQNMKNIIVKELLEIYERKEDNLTESEQKTLDNYGTYLTNAMLTSMGAGEYFAGLIPNSINKPKKKYEATGLTPSIVSFEKEKIELAKKLSNADAFSKVNENFQSGVYEEKKDGNVEQLAYNRFWKGENRIITEELVRNKLINNYNAAISNLIVADYQTGVRLDLGHLLPEGYTLSPSKLVDFQREYDEENQEFKNKFSQVNLKEYEGTRDSDSPFYHSLNFKEVCYGDIIKKGGTLALFHEIAHAWQQAYQGKYERGDFEDFYLDSAVLLGMLEEAQNKLRNGEITQEKFNSRQEYILKILKEKNVEVDIDNFVYKGQELKEGSLILKKYDGKKYVARCESFGKILRAYEKCERDAWAHGLLMLKFLRKNGIDLEPEIKSLADFKEYIEPCLSSYQNAVEQKVEIVGGKAAFVKKK